MISFELGAPQIVVLAIYVCGTVMVATRHGRSREDETYNVWHQLIGVAVWLALLTWGGFFS